MPTMFSEHTLHSDEIAIAYASRSLKSAVSGGFKFSRVVLWNNSDQISGPRLVCAIEYKIEIQIVTDFSEVPPG